MANGNHTPNDIENPPPIPLATLLRNELDALPSFSRMCCIYRVLEHFRHGNDRAYTPQAVFIGPIHHGKEKLKPMKYHKMRCLEDFLKRSNKSREDYIEDCIKMIREKEKLLRSCYAEPIRMASDDFVKVVLVDAAFIIEALLWHIDNPNNENDLMLLENQLPLFIIKELLDTVYVGSHSIVDLSYMLFYDSMIIEGKEENLRRLRSSNVAHFVDFLRSLYVPLSGRGGQIDTVPKVTELHRSGVKFKLGSSQNLFDLRFSKGVLEVPRFKIFDETELLIRNMLAFKQYHYPEENYLSDFVVMMDSLIDTPEDVGLLVKYGILENILGDNATVSTLINYRSSHIIWCISALALHDGVLINYHFYFNTFSKQLNDYYRTSWHKWKANLKQNYFNTPWATVSVIAAIFLSFLPSYKLCVLLSLFNS
ncbi:hypothetical protein UlMin_035522 [Ulmus minor]